MVISALTPGSGGPGSSPLPGTFCCIHSSTCTSATETGNYHRLDSSINKSLIRPDWTGPDHGLDQRSDH